MLDLDQQAFPVDFARSPVPSGYSWLQRPEIQTRPFMPLRRPSGFTLIELAVVIAVIGLLVAGAFASFGAMRINAKLRETHQNVQRVEQLLQTFVLRHGRLPCPARPDLAPGDVGYGEEYRDGTACHPGLENLSAGGPETALFAGTLPAYTLSQRMAMVTDGWDSQFRYVVVSRATTPEAFRNGFGVFPPYRIELVDKPAGAGSEVTVVDNGIAAIVSGGPNRHGAYTLDGAIQPQPPAGAVDERANLELDTPLVSAPYSEASAAPFDDIVHVWSEDELLLPLIKTGDLKSKHAVTRERMQRMVDLIYGWAAQHPERALPSCDGDGTGEISGFIWEECLFPYLEFDLGAVDARDAWGTAMFYIPDADAADEAIGVTIDEPGDEPGDILLEIRSGGPDGNRSALTTDNLVIRHTRAEVVARLAAAGIAVGEPAAPPAPD